MSSNTIQRYGSQLNKVKSLENDPMLSGLHDKWQSVKRMGVDAVRAAELETSRAKELYDAADKVKNDGGLKLEEALRFVDLVLDEFATQAALGKNKPQQTPKDTADGIAIDQAQKQGQTAGQNQSTAQSINPASLALNGPSGANAIPEANPAVQAAMNDLFARYAQKTGQTTPNMAEQTAQAAESNTRMATAAQTPPAPVQTLDNQALLRMLNGQDPALMAQTGQRLNPAHLTPPATEPARAYAAQTSTSSAEKTPIMPPATRADAQNPALKDQDEQAKKSAENVKQLFGFIERISENGASLQQLAS